jgi:hypothetical protein
MIDETEGLKRTFLGLLPAGGGDAKCRFFRAVSRGMGRHDPREVALADDSHTTEQAGEIAEARARAACTGRPAVLALEAMLFQAYPVLDHGFIRVIDYMGDDDAIVQAARVSYGRGTKRVQEDAGLIRYLMRHRHTTPFEMCEI